MHLQVSCLIQKFDVLFQMQSFSLLEKKTHTMLLFSNNLLYFSLQLHTLKEKLPRLDEHFILFGPLTKNRRGQIL